MGTEEDPRVAILKSSLGVIDVVARRVQNVKEIFLFAGLAYEQKCALHMLWVRVNLTVPPRSEQNERLVKQCRELKIAEWRIQTALHSRPVPYR